MATRHAFLVRCPGVAALVLALAASLPAEDWAQWRGTHQNGAVLESPALRETLPESGLVAVWRSGTVPSADDGGWGSPSVADGRLYVHVHTRNRVAEEAKRQYPWIQPEDRTDWSEERFAEYERHRRDEDEKIGKASYTYEEGVLCLDATTGKEIWFAKENSVYTRFPQSGTPTVRDGLVWTLGSAYQVSCHRADTGERRWKTRLPGEFRDEIRMASIAVTDRVAVVQSGRLFGLDRKTGEILWEGDESALRGSHSSPVVWSTKVGELIVANVGDGDTVLLDPRTGTERWRVKSEAGLSTPVIWRGHLVTLGSSRKKGLRAFRITPDSVDELWTYQGLADQGASPVVVDGHVYAQGERRLACVDLATGEERWQTTIVRRDPRFTSLVAADGKVFYVSEGVLAFAANPEGFTELFDGRMNASGVLASESFHRDALDIAKLEADVEGDGRKEAQRLWRDRVDRQGPLSCASPAIVDGRLFVRLREAVACWDLRVDLK